MPQQRPPKLNARQTAFVAAYTGNGTEAARVAGYTGSDNALAVMARKLLRNAQVSAAIKARQDQRVGTLIATREERQTFWTTVMRDKADASLQDRLRASELLGKSEADFTEKHEHGGAGGGPVAFRIVRAGAK